MFKYQEKIKKEATLFRQAIECCDKRKLGITFRDFPRGSCGDTSLLLATYLEHKALGRFQYVCGWIKELWRNQDYSHAWLRQGALIVDITADQFLDGLDPVVVTENDSWHSRFENQTTSLVDIEKYPSLKTDYMNIIGQIKG